jgi:hypothetical protein
MQAASPTDVLDDDVRIRGEIHVQGNEVNMGSFPAKSAVSQPIGKGGDTNGKVLYL